MTRDELRSTVADTIRMQDEIPLARASTYRDMANVAIRVVLEAALKEIDWSTSDEAWWFIERIEALMPEGT